MALRAPSGVGPDYLTDGPRRRGQEHEGQDERGAHADARRSMNRSTSDGSMRKHRELIRMAESWPVAM